jgi:hypothetical protein
VRFSCHFYLLAVRSATEAEFGANTNEQPLRILKAFTEYEWE